MKAKKEAVFKELVSVLEREGYKVRREKLRQGPGWRALSGVCRADSERFVFVDRRLPEDEQIAFLLSKIAGLSIRLEPEAVPSLPDEVRNKLSAS